MGEFSTCLVHALSVPSPSSGENERKVNPLHRALTTSVSFGRFVPESLDWEKWSAFTQNRYMEEVERYSKPGRVAEKKAYFEDHYRKRRAAALLEQENAAALLEQENAAAAASLSETNAKDQVENSSSHDVGTFSLEQEIKGDEEQTRSVESPLPVSSSNHADEEEEIVTEHRHDDDVAEPSLIMENNAIGGDIMSSQDRMCNKDASPSRNSESSSRKKIAKIPASKNDSSSKLVGPRKPAQSRKSGGIRDSKDTVSNYKRRSTAVSHHMSMDLSSCSGEARKARVQGQMKISAPKLIKTHAKTSKNSMPPQISFKATVNGTFNLQHSLPSQTEKRSTKPRGHSFSGNRTDNDKTRLPFSDNSKFSTSKLGNKVTVSSSFVFRSEERAAKRKEFFEKHEQKFQSKKSDEHQVQAAKPQVQVKSRQNSKGLPNSVALKGSANNSRLIPCSPKFQGRAAFKVQDNDSRPPWRFSVNIERLKSVTQKSGRPPVYYANYKKSMCENTPPNINNQL